MKYSTKYLHMILYVFCLSIMTYQLYEGTKKYLSKPVATKVFSKEVELPYISVCHIKEELKLKTVKTNENDPGKALQHRHFYI